MNSGLFIHFVSRNKKANNLPDKKLVESFGVVLLKTFIKGVKKMTIKESTTGCNSTSNPPSNPPPTGKQIRYIHTSRINQKAKIIEKARRDGFISSIEMLNMKIFSGSKRISELKEAGYIFMKTQDWNIGGFATYWYKGHKGDSNE